MKRSSKLFSALLAIAMVLSLSILPAQASNSDQLLGRWVGSEGDEITFFDFSGENRFFALENYFPVEGIYMVSGSSIQFVGRKFEVTIFDEIPFVETQPNDYSVTMTFRLDGDTLTLGGRIYMRDEDYSQPTRQATDSGPIPQPGEYLFGGKERQQATDGWREMYDYDRNIYAKTEYCFIVLSDAANSHGLESATLVLHGNAEGLAAVVTYDNCTCATPCKSTRDCETCTKYYGSRDFYANGEIMTVTVTDPPANTAYEVYLSCRLTRGEGTAWVNTYTNAGLSNPSQWNFTTWDTPLLPTMTRPVGMGSLMDYFYLRDRGVLFLELQQGASLPELRPGSVSTDPRNPGSVEQPTPPVEQPSTWAVEQVNAAIALGLVPQFLQSKYTQAITRAEYCSLAAALYEKYIGAEVAERGYFTDTDDVNVQKMAAVGVVAGVGNDRFAPNDPLTREQAAVMLSRLADALGQSFPAQQPGFSDNDQISTWAYDQVGQAQAAEIMGGVGNNTFAPKGSYTREQSIITMIRLWNTIK